MNRIDRKFRDLKRNRKKAFIAFVTAGDPTLHVTEELVLSFEKNGVDIVELGVPFSDPLADGPTIQASSERALKKGANLPKILGTVRSIRRRSQIPIALMTYYNPVYHYGEKRFLRDACRSGVDGLIIPDLPPEEARGLITEAKRHKLSLVFFLAPTTTPQRARHIARQATGFIYYVSLTGVTGARAGSGPKNTAVIRSVKRITKTPLCVGFGVSTPTQVRSAVLDADGVIVGSAIVNQISKNSGKPALVKNVTRFVRSLAKGLA